MHVSTHDKNDCRNQILRVDGSYRHTPVEMLLHLLEGAVSRLEEVTKSLSVPNCPGALNARQPPRDQLYLCSRGTEGKSSDVSQQIP